MSSERDGWILNGAMTRVWPSPHTSSSLPSDLAADLDAGLTERGGCLVLAAHRSPSDSGDFSDRTGYEAFANHVHVESGGGAALRIGLAAADRISEMVQGHRGDGHVRLIVSAERLDSAIVRFHLLRPGESWLAADIDDYEEPVAFRDVPLSVECRVNSNSSG